MADNFRLRLSDWAHVRIGDAVSVRMGAGWEKGTLLKKASHCVTVRLKARTVACFDPRNVKKA